MDFSRLNLVSIIYLAFRLGPFVMVSYFVIYSMFNRDFSSLIYLAGVLMATFIAVIMSNSLPAFVSNKGVDSFCNVLTSDSGEPISRLPLSIVVYVYTICYFSIPIQDKHTEGQNILFLTLIPVLILFDSIWLYLYGCSNIVKLILAAIPGIAVGFLWGHIVYTSDLQLPQSNKKEAQSMLPSLDTSQYVCIKRNASEGFTNPSLFEGFTNPSLFEGFTNPSVIEGLNDMNSSHPFPSDGSSVQCQSGTSPDGAPKYGNYQLNGKTIQLYPDTTTQKSWDNSQSVTTIDCTGLTLGSPMGLNPDSPAFHSGPGYVPKKNPDPSVVATPQEAAAAQGKSISEMKYEAKANIKDNSSSDSSSDSSPSSSIKKEKPVPLSYSVATIENALYKDPSNNTCHMYLTTVTNQISGSIYGGSCSKYCQPFLDHMNERVMPDYTALLSQLNQEKKDTISDPGRVQVYMTAIKLLMDEIQKALDAVNAQEDNIDSKIYDILVDNYTKALSTMKSVMLPT